MPRVIHFEIPADDPERAAKFYRNAVGWEVQTWGGPAEYWLASTGPDEEPGINGAIMRRPAWGACTIHVQVPSVDEHIVRVEEAGGEVMQGKSPIPGIGYMAYCRDTEGNVFGIYEDDPSAA
jgi:hypothetical protein